MDYNNQPQHTNKSSKLIDIAILRCIAVISLVIWHSYCSYIVWDIAETPAKTYYSFIFMNFIPDANMPLFTFISGYLFCYLFAQGRYSKFKKFLINKVHRLLIPFLVLGTVINLTERGKSITDILYGAPNHLWYCLMLFYCFIFCWLIESKLGRKYNVIAMLISFGLIFIKGIGALGVFLPLGIFYPCYYYAYFYIGFLLFEYKNQLISLMNKYWFVVLSIFIILCFYNLNYHLIAISALSYILLLIWLMNKKEVINFYTNKIWFQNSINLIGKLSFGIYVFHQWIIWNVTRTPEFHPMINEHYILFPAILSVAVFLISMLLTWLSIKTKVGKYLLT